MSSEVLHHKPDDMGADVLDLIMVVFGDDLLDIFKSLDREKDLSWCSTRFRRHLALMNCQNFSMEFSLVELGGGRVPRSPLPSPSSLELSWLCVC